MAADGGTCGCSAAERPAALADWGASDFDVPHLSLELPRVTYPPLSGSSEGREQRRNIWVTRSSAGTSGSQGTLWVPLGHKELCRYIRITRSSVGASGSQGAL